MFFETYESDRNLMGTALTGTGGHAWLQVKLGHFVPFFIMEVGPTERYLGETWLVGSISCLLANHAMLKKEFPQREASTFLVMAGQMKRGGQRLIEPLAEVWEREYDACSDPEFRYVLSDGRVLIHGPEIGQYDESDATPWERRF